MYLITFSSVTALCIDSAIASPLTPKTGEGLLWATSFDVHIIAADLLD